MYGLPLQSIRFLLMRSVSASALLAAASERSTFDGWYYDSSAQ